MSPAQLQCIEPDCNARFETSSRLYTCARCGGLLDVVYDLESILAPQLVDEWDRRFGSFQAIDRSGVWRFRELLPEAAPDEIVSMAEGNTPILDAPSCARYAGMNRLAFKHLGFNPTGSFKDLGMTTGVTQARRLGATRVACASTGNTSASMAAYAARAGMKAFVFIPSGQIALGKLAQALDYGATVLQLDGDFDAAMRLVREVTSDSDLYLLNSVNPFRLEGQKTIAFELLQQRRWRTPDRIVAPGGNLGNSSAIAKGLKELLDAGAIPRMPRLTIVQAEGANPLYRMWTEQADRLTPLEHASTLATAIKIGAPVSWRKAQRGLEWSGGDVEQVGESEIADAKAMIGRDGIGCEPASAVTLAGIKKMVEAGRIDKDEDVVAILTGHALKDPDYTINYHRGELAFTDSAGKTRLLPAAFASPMIRVAPDRDAILAALE
ncbi:MAG: threonine synthase [Blastocatellales bacterium]|nr:threonine synthase [Blastocatellales bacterium]